MEGRTNVANGEGRSQVGEPPWDKGGIGAAKGYPGQKKQGPVMAPVFLFSYYATGRFDHFFFLLSNSMTSSVRSFGVRESTTNSTDFSSTSTV